MPAYVTNIFLCKQNVALPIIRRIIVSKSVFFPQVSFALVRNCSTSYKTIEETVQKLSSQAVEPEHVVKQVKNYKENVDWLPFQWRRRPKLDVFADSGDYVKHMEYDLSWPKPDFEFSEELKTASDAVKQKFTLATARKGEIKETVTRKTLERIQRHPHDLDSLEVRIALKTITVRSLFEHSEIYPKDSVHSRIWLHNSILKRNRLLKLLRNVDTERFKWVCEELKLYYKPQTLGGIVEFYCRKWDLRRLTKEYSAKMVEDKKKAYHEELKRQQQEFVKEKAEILAWIEKEEKELANLTI